MSALPAEKCHACVHRRDVSGSAHSSCQHPATADVHADPADQLIGLLGRRSGTRLIPSRAAVTLRITGALQGIHGGWFIWPVNFDPTWLETCDGFTAKPADDGGRS